MATEKATRPVVFGRHLPLRMADDTIKLVEQVMADLHRDRSYTVRYLLGLGLTEHLRKARKRAGDRAYQARRRRQAAAR